MQAEGQASSQRNRLHQAEAALYGPGSRSPKELQDLTADVAALKRYLVTLDAAEVSWMEKLEAAEEGVGRAKSALEAAQARSDASRPVLLAQERDLLREQEKLQAERAAAVGALPAALLDTYEGLRRMRRGVAVVEVLDGACGACGTSLTAALQQSARHAAVPVTCPNCGRFLFGG